jgi:hypothetical protein
MAIGMPVIELVLTLSFATVFENSIIAKTKSFV